jgi:fermentation-respiration switch protein FrsA (DUF1100 family)
VGLAGLDFREAINYGAAGASEFDDVLGAGLYVRTRPDVDPKRIGLPLASIDTWRSPVLLIHGDDDHNVPFHESVALTEALRKQHVELEELVFPDEIHGFLTEKRWLDAYHAAADFFNDGSNTSPVRRMRSGRLFSPPDTSAEQAMQRY